MYKKWIKDYGLLFTLFVIALYLNSCFKVDPPEKGVNSYQAKGITITDKGKYFEVILDFTCGLTHGQIGESYGKGILAVVPNYESLIDSYLNEINNRTEYINYMLNVEDVKRSMEQDYLDEISGLASVFTGTENKKGDSKISADEFLLFNLIPDCARPSQCSFISVFGTRSYSQKTISGRVLDWYGGGDNQLPKIQAIVYFKYSNTTLCMITYLGYMGALTLFNEHKVFAAIMDSGSDSAYTAEGRRSYSFDLRKAMETQTTMRAVAAFMMNLDYHYTYNHLIAFSDPTESLVLENNFSGRPSSGNRVQRALRSSGSPLINEVKWDFPDCIASVNSFLLKGNYDNQKNNKYNTGRWANIIKTLSQFKKPLTPGDLKTIVSFNHGSPGSFSDSGDIYNALTQQIIIFEPETLRLEIFFHPADSFFLPSKPEFIKIETDIMLKELNIQLGNDDHA